MAEAVETAVTWVKRLLYQHLFNKVVSLNGDMHELYVDLSKNQHKLV